MMVEILCLTWSCIAVAGMVVMCIATKRADRKRKAEHKARIEMMQDVKHIIKVMEEMKHD